MALNVEDGTGRADATSYVSLADAAAYFALRGMEAWADMDEAEQEAALVRASFGLDIKYRGKWIGQKRTANQRLAWPRSQALGSDLPLQDSDGAPIPTDAVPMAIKDACCEVAYIEMTDRFNTASVSRDDMIKRDKTDVLETEWFAGAQALATKQFPMIDALLTGYALLAGSGAIGFNLLLTDRERNQHEDGFNVEDSPYFIQG